MYSKSKFYIFITLTLALVLSSAGFSFADSDPVTEIPVGSFADASSSSFANASLKLWTRTDDSSLGGALVAGQTGSFVFFYDRPELPSVICWAIIVFDSSDSVQELRYSGSWSITYFDTSHNTPTTDSTTGLTYYKSNINKSGLTLNPDIPHYSTLAEGLASASQFLSSVADLYSCSIPAGYALHIYSNSAFTLGDIDLSITDSYNFDRINGVSYRYNGARLHSMLTENMVDNYSANAWSMVPWEPTNANIFGKASNYAYHYDSDQTVPVGESWVIVNPLYYGSWAQNEYEVDTNVPIQVTISYNHSDTVYFDLVPLTASVTYENGVGSYLNVFSPSKGVIHGVLEPPVDPDDSGTIDFGVPPVGGGNTGQPSVNGSSSLVDIIENFLNSVTRIFNAGINAVRTVINTGTTFLSYVSSMFSWLPPELSTIIFSVLTIILVAGVLKLI